MTSQEVCEVRFGWTSSILEIMIILSEDWLEFPSNRIPWPVMSLTFLCRKLLKNQVVQKHNAEIKVSRRNAFAFRGFHGPELSVGLERGARARLPLGAGPEPCRAVPSC